MRALASEIAYKLLEMHLGTSVISIRLLGTTIVASSDIKPDYVIPSSEKT